MTRLSAAGRYPRRLRSPRYARVVARRRFTPSVVTASPQSIDVPTAELVLSAVAPTIAGAGAASLAIPTADLVLSGVSPTISANAEIAIPTADLVLSAVAPTVAGAGAASITVPSGDVVLAGVSPVVAGSSAASLTVPTALLTLAGVPPVVFAGTWPTSVSGREILDQNGNPYPIKGMAAWTATQNLTNADITTMLEGLAGYGINSVMMAPCGLLWNDTAGTSAANRYENFAGDPFFTGTPFQSSLGAAWSSVDHFMDEARRLGLTVFFTWYAGNLSTYGQSDEWTAATNAQVRTVGSDVATRYPVATYPNLVWVFGADAAFSAASTIGQRLDSIARGVADVETTRLTVAHPDKRDNGTYDSGRDQFGSGYTFLTLDINSIYTYQDDLADQWDSVYAEASVPVINIEPVYAHNTGQEPGSGPVSHDTGEGAHLREQAWVSFVRGGSGIMHGDEDFWPFGATGLYSGGGDWELVLSDPSPGAEGPHDDPLIWLSHLWDFIAEFTSWSDLVPDADTFLTSGEGTVNSRASAGLAGDLAVVYFPSSRGSIVVDTTQLTGTNNVRLRWLDPTDGGYTVIAASEAQNATRSVTYPTSNSNSNSSDDWVLVVDLLTEVSIEVPTGIINLTGVAPTIAGSSAATITVPTADATLAAVAPDVAGSGVAPLIVPTADLALTGVSPDVAAAGVASIDVPTGDVILTGVAPTVSGAGASSFTVPSGDMVMSGVAPVVSGAGDASFTVPTADLVLEGVAPDLVLGAAPQSIDVPTAELTISALAPTLAASGSASITVPPADLTLSGVAPVIAGAGSTTFDIPTADLTLTAVAPTVAGAGSTSITVPVADLALTSVTPTITATGEASITIPVAELILTGVPPAITVTGPQSITVPAAELILTGVAPVVTRSTVNKPGVIVIEGLRPEISVRSLAPAIGVEVASSS